MKASNVALSIVCGPFICAYLIFASCFCPTNSHRDTPNEERVRFERRQRAAPRPLPRRTSSRRLTLPLVSSETSRGRTHDQSQSRLMQLPLELRRMIWRAVLGDSRYHIIRKENKIGHLRCKRTRYYGCLGAWDWETPSRLSCWGNLDSAEIWHPLSGRNEPTDGDIIPFLQACRQVYSESIDLLYSTNYFSFKDIDCLRFLAYTTLPHRFNLIRKIEITWPLQWPIYDPLIQNLMLSEPALYPPHDEATWESTWGIIAQMPKLKYIRVNLCHCHGFREPESETKMFKSMLQVKHVKDFEVTVSWPAQDLPEAPFKLLRTHDPRLSPLASPDDQDW